MMSTVLKATEIVSSSYVDLAQTPLDHLHLQTHSHIVWTRVPVCVCLSTADPVGEALAAQTKPLGRPWYQTF